MRLIAIVLLHLAALAATASDAWAGGKVALVVGNSNYTAAGRLDNPPNDTRIVGDALRRSGFEVIPVNDAKLSQFRAAMREFRGKALGADVAVVYFAGHGIEANGRNWLIPVDAKLESDFDLVDEAIDLDRVMEALDGAKVRVVVLDACRNNPFTRNWSSGRRSVTRGLAPVEADDVLVIYAAAPGQFAFDGDGANSPFALSLAARLVEPGLPLQLLGGLVRDDVLAATGGKQRPFQTGSMTGTPIYLLPRMETALAQIEPQRPVPSASLGGGVDVAALIGECDRQAGLVNDPRQPTGVAFDEILPVLAIKACRRALDADQNNPKMMFQLGRALNRGEQYSESKLLLERAAAGNNAAAMNGLGVIYHNGKGVAQDYSLARRWYEQAAAKGNYVAMNNLGILYRDGLGVAQDYAQARRWYEQAAAESNADAMNNLGALYYNGQGVAQDYVQARRWYEQAAAKGNDAAMNNVGVLYYNGRGVVQDYAQARRWYEQAAAKGNVDAMFNLGYLYDNGQGVAQDYALARKWYEQAAAKGSGAAKEWLTRNPG